MASGVRRPARPARNAPSGPKKRCGSLEALGFQGTASKAAEISPGYMGTTSGGEVGFTPDPVEAVTAGEMIRSSCLTRP